ncbi:SWIB-domain-containing protein [Butyriboletus roseoflavus]|nr:SWIB-domain-containing protein [Butyriboletus roseoflavus]
MSLNLEALEEPITRILTAPGTDLSTISARRVRKALLGDPQYAFLRLTPELLKTRRADVDQVISRIFELVNQAATSGGSKRKWKEEDEEDGVDGAGEGDEQLPTEPSEDVEEVEDTKPPKKKKGKRSVEESDAALARKLSTEINSRSRRGAVLAAGASSPRKPKRKPKKSAETVDSGEEDDEDGEAKPKKRSVAKGGFAKEYTLSVPLSAVIEVEKLSRPQVVKKLWEYIRQHELQNPSNRKEIICDDALRAVFAVDKIDMFRMNKVLGQYVGFLPTTIFSLTFFGRHLHEE